MRNEKDDTKIFVFMSKMVTFLRNSVTIFILF